MDLLIEAGSRRGGFVQIFLQSVL